MVSTRSHSVLSAEGAHGDAHGEVNSAAPTPRRSGRLRSSGGAAPAAEQAPPTTARSARSRRTLKAIEEEPQQPASQPAAEEEGADEQLSPRARRLSAAPAVAASQDEQEDEDEEEDDDDDEEEEEAAAESSASEDEEEAEAAEQQQQQQQQQQPAAPLRAAAAVVDLLAEEMFAALDGAFGEQGSAGSDSDSDSEAETAAAAQQQQQRVQGAESDDDSSDSEGEDADPHSIPEHLRWRPELTLPGMGGAAQQQQRQQQRSGVAPAAAAGVQPVRRAADALHVQPVDARALTRAARKAAPDTAGKGWFDMPATQITDEVKRDLRMLRLRGALDPKAHYKKLDSTKFPKYFQMGTVVEGAADFYSGRLTNKQRKRTLTDEIMADEHLTQVRKKRFTKLQEEKGKWAGKKGRKTSNERRPKAHHRPKH